VRSTIDTVLVIAAPGPAIGHDRGAVGEVGEVPAVRRPAALVGDPRLVALEDDLPRSVSNRNLLYQRIGAGGENS
jgi:hypothetical protein